jgi:hypothetical protein
MILIYGIIIVNRSQKKADLLSPGRLTPPNLHRHLLPSRPVSDIDWAGLNQHLRVYQGQPRSPTLAVRLVWLALHGYLSIAVLYEPCDRQPDPGHLREIMPCKPASVLPAQPLLPNRPAHLKPQPPLPIPANLQPQPLQIRRPLQLKVIHRPALCSSRARPRFDFGAGRQLCHPGVRGFGGWMAFDCGRNCDCCGCWGGVYAHAQVCGPCCGLAFAYRGGLHFRVPGGVLYTQGGLNHPVNQFHFQ